MKSAFSAWPLTYVLWEMLMLYSYRNLAFPLRGNRNLHFFPVLQDKLFPSYIHSSSIKKKYDDGLFYSYKNSMACFCSDNISH